MGDTQEPDRLEGASGDEPPDGTQDGQPDAGQGGWTPDQQAAITRMRQRDREELKEERERLRREFDERLAELREQRQQPAPDAPGPDAHDPAVVAAADRAFQATPTYRALMERNARLHQRLTENSIEGGIDALRSEPFFEEVEPEVRSALHRIASDPNGPGVSRSTARYVYLDRVYPRLTKALEGAKSDADAARAELREKLNRVNAPGSVSGASGDAGSQVDLSDDEIAVILEESSEEEFAKLMGPQAP